MNNTTVKLRLHPLERGDNNITRAFLSGEIGFEIEICKGTSVYREILTYEQAEGLGLAIKSSMGSYWEFKPLNKNNV